MGPWNFLKMKTLTPVRQRAHSPKIGIWTSKIIPHLWLVDLFWPIKKKFHTKPYCTCMNLSLKRGDRTWKWINPHLLEHGIEKRVQNVSSHIRTWLWIQSPECVLTCWKMALNKESKICPHLLKPSITYSYRVENSVADLDDFCPDPAPDP